VKLDEARPLQGLQRFDRGAKLHPVVRRERLAAADLALFAAGSKKRGPAARPRVSAAGAVSEQLDFRQLGQGAARAEA
jgi:hypothetical protein